ncbi:STAS domain-containing protein [Streptomyces sp. NPDC057616]|uniref:STAS domain-containing protein n=1 Tax=Streptomyces sp. NPDC057616 TaxID=3346183 RepID=UPI00369E1A6F
MALPQLNAHRHDRATRALITLAGEFDLTTVPLAHAALGACLRDGIRTIDVDLTAFTFCDASGLNAFLAASGLAADAGTTLQLHYSPPTLTPIIDITGTGFLLHELHTVRRPSPRVPAAAGGAP